ncbi:hypothetical protein LEL_10769 [Akanthomyces lecanii RCEF 1005]|uniref:Uncharacterized protein n=1 Tax=Akanthomyces lecanii RCEF 1005 TaxID=1081108 RepID=A0A167TS65_CORDF|nr:hypothetical protein LEL_10769 [Akanthomyces lecanii RCEF 1005]
MERQTGDRATDPKAVNWKQCTIMKLVEEELVSGENTPREATVCRDAEERYNGSRASDDDTVSAGNSDRTTILNAQSNMCQHMEPPLRPSTLASNYDNDAHGNDDDQDEGYGADDSHVGF